MLSIILLSLLGLGAGVFLFDELSSDDDDPAPRQGDDDPAEEGGDGDGEGSIDGEVFSGTEGADTITPELARDFPTEVKTFNMLGGDDDVDFGPDTNVTINGGEGDDTLSIVNEENLLDGGAGDDVLSAELGSTVLGGAGDDVIAFDQGDGIVDGSGEVRGDAGDDTINVNTVVGFIVSDNGPVDVFGGDGADSITVAIDEDASSDFEDPAEPREDPTLVNIRDFTPGEDVLVVDVTAFEESSERDLVDTELNTRTDGGYELVLTFSATGTTPAVSTSMNIDGPGPITLDDIVFVQA